MEFNDLELFYKALSKRDEEYVFTGKVVEQLPDLIEYCRTKTDNFVWFIGGPLFWLISWNVQRKLYLKNGIGKLEQKIIHGLNEYEIEIKNKYALLIRRDQ
ncbi:hypothetical protein ACWOFR_17915 [Carnobacterium gallinarum]|uniref:hypothetical protein n=1 Tax=Carnobacterium gallinarum TaxID=2749 RepID=UPI0005545D59|nr:hypothetical protein [Carnobacterium gallinarum]